MCTHVVPCSTYFTRNAPDCAANWHSTQKFWWSGHQSVVELCWFTYLQLSATQKSCLQEAYPAIDYYHFLHCYIIIRGTIHDSPNNALDQLVDLSLAFQHPYLGIFVHGTSCSINNLIVVDLLRLPQPLRCENFLANCFKISATNSISHSDWRIQVCLHVNHLAQ